MMHFALPLLLCAAAWPPAVAKPGREPQRPGRQDQAIRSPVFPQPREMTAAGQPFAIDQNIVIAGPAALARILQSDLAERYGVAVRAVAPGGAAAEARAIVIKTTPGPDTPEQPEGYLLEVSAGRVVITGADAAGAFYAVQTLRQLIEGERGARVPAVRIRDWPYKPFRGIKLYLPGRESIPFFKRFVRDFMALYKFNKAVVEINAGVRFDRHPELNAGWLEFARDLVLSRRDRPRGRGEENQNSAHHDTADFGIIEKEDLADLVRYTAENHIEFIPEVPSLSHSYYLLTRHRELAENSSVEWPDSYCPSLPGSYKLLFDVIDEIADVTKPRMMHMGKDEWRMHWAVCPRCRKRDYREVYIEDIQKTYEHLKKRGIRMAMWGDHLIEPLRGEGVQEKTGTEGERYLTPGAIRPGQVKAQIPKDILIFNWFWDESYAPRQGEKNDRAVSDWGFEQVYGNMTPDLLDQDYARRSAIKGMLGGAPSSWAATTEFNFGKDLIAHFLACASMLWSGSDWPGSDQLIAIVQDRMPSIRRSFTGAAPPSALDPVHDLAMKQPVTARMPGGSSEPIAIGEDASSLIFIHAALKPAGSVQAYRLIYNFEDVADLLGWYEVVYEDGLVVTVPIRYKVNILESSPQQRTYCYRADPVELPSGERFFAFEWVNPRFGKKIESVRLRTPRAYTGVSGRPIGDNGVTLAGIRVVSARPVPNPGRAGSNGEAGR